MDEKRVNEFTELLASRAAVPGGGGGSALAGAIGIALGHMVGELTVGKKKYAAVEEEMQALMREAETLRAELLSCIQEDAEAFEPLSRAYGIDRNDPSRGEIMERCLRDAAAAPAHILRLCCRSIELMRAFADKGSTLAVSDAATGAMICHGALYGAAVNVKVNTSAMKDRAYASRLDREVDSALETYGRMAEEIYHDVYGRFC